MKVKLASYSLSLRFSEMDPVRLEKTHFWLSSDKNQKPIEQPFDGSVKGLAWDKNAMSLCHWLIKYRLSKHPPNVGLYEIQEDNKAELFKTLLNLLDTPRFFTTVFGKEREEGRKVLRLIFPQKNPRQNRSSTIDPTRLPADAITIVRGKDKEIVDEGALNKLVAQIESAYLDQPSRKKERDAIPTQSAETHSPPNPGFQRGTFPLRGNKSMADWFALLSLCQIKTIIVAFDQSATMSDQELEPGCLLVIAEKLASSTMSEYLSFFDPRPDELARQLMEETLVKKFASSSELKVSIFDLCPSEDASQLSGKVQEAVSKIISSDIVFRDKLIANIVKFVSPHSDGRVWRLPSNYFGWLELFSLLIGYSSYLYLIQSETFDNALADCLNNLHDQEFSDLTSDSYYDESDHLRVILLTFRCLWDYGLFWSAYAFTAICLRNNCAVLEKAIKSVDGKAVVTMIWKTLDQERCGMGEGPEFNRFYERFDNFMAKNKLLPRKKATRKRA